jgi:hypothetical protein
VTTPTAPWTLSPHCPKPNSCTRHVRCMYVDIVGGEFVASCEAAAARPHYVNCPAHPDHASCVCDLIAQHEAEGGR